MTETKGILIVSFGTSHSDTRAKTLDAIEKSIAINHKKKVYHAWTSKMIIRKLQRENNEKVFTVLEALEQMKQDGITDLIVQPTHILNGIENDIMIQELATFQQDFKSIKLGSPILSSTEDMKRLIQIIMADYAHLPTDEVLVLMGHGTAHHVNPVYAALNYMFKDEGFENVFVGTVEAYPSLEPVIRQVKKIQPKRVHLAPFMIVAGEHVKNDMAGNDEDSWKSQFEQLSYPVTCHLKGLGEYEGVWDLLNDHILEARSFTDNESFIIKKLLLKH